jgi:ankyrin repeat protein
MYNAINDGDIEEFERLVSLDPTLLNTPLNERDKLLPIHHAASIGNTKVVEWIAKRYTCLIDREDAFKTTPLYYAAKNNHCSTVEMLINFGSTALDTVDHRDFSPLHIAAYQGHTAMVELLVRLGSRMINLPASNHYTPMGLATQQGHTDVVRTLIKLGSSVGNGHYKNGIQPIHFAAAGGHIQMIEMFVEKGVSVDTTAANGKTPLHYAAMYNRLDVIKLLVRLGSLMLDRQCTKEGSTPLMMVITDGCMGQYVETIELLLKLGSKSIDTGNMYYDNPIIAAISRNNTAMIECLIANGSRFLNMADRTAYKDVLRIGGRYTAFRTLLALGYDQELYRSWCEQKGVEPVIMDEEMVVDVRWRVYFRKPLVHRLLDI